MADAISEFPGIGKRNVEETMELRTKNGYPRVFLFS